MTNISGKIDPLDRPEPTGEGLSRIKRTGEAGNPPPRKDDSVEIRGGALGAEEAAAINLRGIAPVDAEKLLESPAFKDWGSPYSGEAPGTLLQLERALKHSAQGTLAAEDHTYLEMAGTLIAAAQAAAAETGKGREGSIGQLQAEAQEVSAKLARQRAQQK